MMLKEKSNPWARAKYLYVLPLAATVLTAFARPEISDNLNEISAIKVKDITSILETKAANNVATVKDSLPEKSNIKTYVVEDDSTLVTFYSYADSLVSISVMSDTLKYKNVIVSAEPSVIYVKDTIIDGKTSIVTITTGGKEKVMVKSSAISRKIIPDSTQLPIFLLNDKEVDYQTIQTLVPETIKSITVLKDQAAITAYGKKAQNGVVVVESLMPNEKISVITTSTITLADGTKVKLNKNEGLQTKISDISIAQDSSTSRVVDLQGEAYFTVMKNTEGNTQPFLAVTGIRVDDNNSTSINFEKNTAVSSSVINVEGKVLDINGNPLKGATIATEGTETLSDSKGNFFLVTGKNDKLTITYPGMKKVKIKTSKNLTVYMKKL